MTTNVFKDILLIVSLIFICINNVKTAENISTPLNATGLEQPFSNDFSINLDIHGIDGYSNILPNQYNSGIFPSTHPIYNVHNIGRVGVTAIAKYGTAFEWTGEISRYTIDPRTRGTLDSSGKPYYVTGVQIFNDQNTRAIVHVSGGSRKENNNPWEGFDKNKALKGAFALGVKNIPSVGNYGLRLLISAFWPVNKPNVWEQVHTQVKTLLDNRIQQTISEILDGDIRYMRDRIAALDSETRSNNKNDIADHYMNIAQDLIGFEQKFQFSPASTQDYLITNFNILPHYSSVITLKMHFYAIGLATPQVFSLNTTQVAMIRQYANTTLFDTNSKGAISYVTKMYDDVLDETYRTVYAGGLYNVMMNARSHIVLHGLELIPIWRQAYSHPGSTTYPYIDAVSYSNLFGRATPNLFQQATFRDVPVPLTPPLKSDGTRRKLVSLDIYIWRIYGNGPARIGGMKLIFEGNIVYSLGTTTKERKMLILNGRTITKLRAYGSGAIDRLDFTLSDGLTITYGVANNNVFTDFQLIKHYIASVYTANDFSSLDGQAANIAVSYLQIPVIK